MVIFHQDILLNKAVWTNRKGRDFKYWLQSYHPLFGLLSVPQYHIYSKQYRLTDLALILCFGAFWSAFACYYTQILFNLPSIGENLYYPKLLLVSFVNTILIAIIEWIFVTKQCFKRCFKIIFDVPGSMLIIVTIIGILGSAVIAAEILFDISRFMFIFTMTFLILWSFQLIVCYLSFEKKWKFDHSLIDAAVRESTFHKSSKHHGMGGVSMVTVPKNPYYITYRDYTEYICQKGVDGMDISISNDDEHSNNPVLGYAPPNMSTSDTDQLLLNGNSSL